MAALWQQNWDSAGFVLKTWATLLAIQGQANTDEQFWILLNKGQWWMHVHICAHTLTHSLWFMIMMLVVTPTGPSHGPGTHNARLCTQNKEGVPVLKSLQSKYGIFHFLCFFLFATGKHLAPCCSQQCYWPHEGQCIFALCGNCFPFW